MVVGRIDKIRNPKLIQLSERSFIEERDKFLLVNFGLSSDGLGLVVLSIIESLQSSGFED